MVMRLNEIRDKSHFNGASHFIPDQSRTFKSEMSEAEHH